MTQPRKLYKLTDENGQTMGGTQWGPGVTHTATGEESQELCSDGWIHAYTDPLLAVLLNPVHADFEKPQLWEARGIIGEDDRGLKVGCRTLTTVRQIPLPQVSNTQRVAFGILCALQVEKSAKFRKWAKSWLSGEDRTAYYAAASVAAASVAAASAAAYVAAYANASVAAAYAAASAATSASKKPLPLTTLAKKAMRY